MSTRIERAWLLFEQSRYELAEKELGLALAEDPDNSPAHSVMALCLLAREKFDAAAEHARRGVACGPDEALAHYVLACVWEARNYLDEAETAIATALELDSTWPEFHTLLGAIRLRRRDWAGAEAAAAAALEIDPEYVDAVNLKARALRRQGEKRLAGEELIEALRIDPDEAETHANLGWNYLEAGNRAKATEHFREALRLNPELEWARVGVIETLKSHNLIYRGLLKYFFWMSNFGEKGQWMIVVGAWLAFIVAMRIADAHPTLAPWLTPLLVVYLVFALSTWMAVPLANLALRLHPFGRLALSGDERIASNWVGGFLAAAIVAGVAFWITGTIFTRELLIFFGLMVIPISATFRCESPWPRRALVVYSLVVGTIGLAKFGLCLMVILGDPDSWSRDFTVLWVTAFGVAVQAFSWGAVLSMWVGNIALSVRWRR